MWRSGHKQKSKIKNPGVQGKILGRASLELWPYRAGGYDGWLVVYVKKKNDSSNSMVNWHILV